MRRCLACMEQYSEEYQMCPHCGAESDIQPQEAYHMKPGTYLSGRYLVGQALGFGGFGVTYIGYDTTLDRKVAIKEYLPSDFSTRIPGQTEITTYEGDRNEQFVSGLEKFFHEAQMLAKMQQANGIVQIYNTFQENRTAYIVMEYLEGKTLKTHLEERGKISIAEAKEIMHPVIEALSVVHAAGVIHRDIAPDNIFLTNDGQVKLLDFGAARFATTSHSKSLSVILKSGYAPVEQYRSRGDQGPWTDVYSLAATIHRSITGQLPEDAMERISEDNLQKPSKLGVQLSKSEENAIMNALHIKVEDRTPSIEEFEKELYHDDQVKLRRSTMKKSDVGKWPLWTKLLIGAACLGLVAFGGALATGLIDYSYLVPAGMPLPEGKTRVPNVVNANVPRAEEMTTEAELVFQIVDKQYSEFIPADMVLKQGTDRGKIVDTNNVLEVYISGGKQSYIMLDVCGMTQPDAILALVNYNLDIEVVEEYSAVATGYIITQSVPAGDQIHRGDPLKLVVSKGYDSYIDVQQEVEVPDLVGLSFEEAQAEVAKKGLYLVKFDTKESAKPVNTLLEQSPAAGERVHQGDRINIVLAIASKVYRVPDVQYKEESVAVTELKTVGLTVDVTYEESKAVAKGKVISQSIDPDTEVKSGQTISIVVSSGSKDLIIQEWSEWVAELPAGIDKKQYEIDTKTQYSIRQKTTTTSYEPNLNGWTLSGQETETGEFGPWSPWSTTAMTATADRQVENKVQYSYRDYQTTTSDDSNLAGWSLINRVENGYTNQYGALSDWSETVYYDSATRKVHSKQQYSYATGTRTTEKTTSSDSNLSGWTKVGSNVIVTYGSEQQFGSPQDTNYYQYVREETVKSGSHVEKYYQRYYCPYHGGSHTAATSSKCNGSVEGYWLSPSLTSSAGGGWAKDAVYLDGLGITTGYPFRPTNTRTVDDYKTVYYYKPKSTRTEYYYERVIVSGFDNWSAWSDTPVSASDTVEVRTRTVYAYQDLIPAYKYNYERWTDWSVWDDAAVSVSATREVRSQSIYKYREKVDRIKYTYYKWSDWTEYGDEKRDPSQDIEVNKRTMYRYRPKNS